MRAWALMLGGLIVWTVHFFALYSLASIFGSSMTARIGVGVVTLLCLAADVALLLLCARLNQGAGSDIPSWARAIGTMAVSLSLIAVIWQALPSLLI